jgi:glyoxylase-like metal-dependent hydrolase (beta-lactamase superfamily II)
MARRFDTRFFVADLPPDGEPCFRSEEVVAHRWATPRAALDAMAAGEIDLWVPTSATLQQLEDLEGLEALRRLIVHGHVAPPRLVDEGPGLSRIVVSGAGGIPGQTVNAYLVGRERCVVVDPGDPSDEAASVVLGAAEAASGRIELIALTSADPAHAGGAEGLALRLGIPVAAGPGAGRDLPYEVRELADGEQLQLGGATLTAFAMPGPRPEHIVFDADGALLSGDLAGTADPLTPASCVDRSAWDRSRERLRAMGTRRLYPGHGEPPDRPRHGGSAGE